MDTVLSPAGGSTPKDGLLDWQIVLEATKALKKHFLKENGFNLWVENCEQNKKPWLNSQ